MVINESERSIDIDETLEMRLKKIKSCFSSFILRFFVHFKDNLALSSFFCKAEFCENVIYFYSGCRILVWYVMSDSRMIDM